MFTITVNPITIRPGDEIKTGALKFRKVKRVEFCRDANKIHLDHECYDTRFNMVTKKVN